MPLVIDMTLPSDGDVLREWCRPTRVVIARWTRSKTEPAPAPACPDSWTIVASSTSGEGVYRLAWTGDTPFILRGALSEAMAQDISDPARPLLWMP